MIKLRFLPDAEAELLNQVKYLSATRNGLGAKFQRALESAFNSAMINPDGGTHSAGGTRRRLVKGFPFSIVYRVSETELLIVAIVHHRRKPGYWLSRIENG